jgi:hypothetical protein
MAAQALIETHLEEESVRQTYTHALAETILPELQTGRWLARLLYDFPRTRSWAFARHGQRLCEAVTDVMAGMRTYRELVFSSRSILKLLTPTWLRRSAYRPARPNDGQA